MTDLQDGLPANLTIEELAEFARLTPAGVRTMLKNGTAPRSFRAGKRRLFAREDVLAWRDSTKTPAA